MPKRVVFIVEGSNTSGMGHVYEGISLAQELKNEVEITFLTQSDHVVVEKIKDFELLVRRAETEKSLIEDIISLNPEVISIHVPAFEEQLLENIKGVLAQECKLIFSPNTLLHTPKNATLHSDAIIYNIVGNKKFENLRFYDQDSKTLNLWGPRYFILAPEFYRVKRKSFIVSGFKSVLLSFGGSDPLNLSLKVLRRIVNIFPTQKISVILGPHYENHEEFFSFIESLENDIEVHQNVKNVAEFMSKADLIFTSPGRSVWEAVRIGVTQIAICQNEIQYKTYETLPFVFYLEEIDDFSKLIHQSIPDFYEDYERLTKLDPGEGVREIVSLIRDNWEENLN